MESGRMIVVCGIIVLAACVLATAGEKRPTPDLATLFVVMEVGKNAPEGAQDTLKEIASSVGGFRTIACRDAKTAARDAMKAGAGAILQVELIPGPKQIPNAEYKRPSRPKIKYELQQITSAGPKKIASGTLVVSGKGEDDEEGSLSLKEELAAAVISKLVPCKIKSIKKGEDAKIVVTVANKTGTPIDGITLAEGEARLTSEKTEIKPRETKDVEILVGDRKVDFAKAKFTAISFVRDESDDEGEDEKDDGEKDDDADDEEKDVDEKGGDRKDDNKKDDGRKDGGRKDGGEKDKGEE